MKETALAADRTVAFDGFYLRWRFDLKPYPAAMASTVVLDRMNPRDCLLGLSPPVN